MSQLLANGVLLLHLGFVLFVAFGGGLVLWFPRIAWLHLPAAAWGAIVEFANLSCPLTRLENHLRALAGLQTTEQDFVSRMILPVLYPQGLTREGQLLLGLAVVILNLAVYGWGLRRWWKASATG